MIIEHTQKAVFFRAFLQHITTYPPPGTRYVFLGALYPRLYRAKASFSNVILLFLHYIIIVTGVDAVYYLPESPQLTR